MLARTPNRLHCRSIRGVVAIVLSVCLLGCQLPQCVSSRKIPQSKSPVAQRSDASTALGPTNNLQLAGYSQSATQLQGSPVAANQTESDRERQPASNQRDDINSAPWAPLRQPTGILSAPANESSANTGQNPAELPAPQSENTAQYSQSLTLPEAISLAYRMQPRLRASLASIRQAQGRDEIAFAAYLPFVSTAYSVGGYELNVGGPPVPLPSSPPFTFIPGQGSVPVGLNIQTGYELAELKLEWLICDFGRRSGLYHQAGLAVDIAQLQSERAYQTVANEVSTAYYQVLRVRSLRRIADESVRRAKDDRDEAAKLAKSGVIEREKVLRAEVALSQAQRAVDIAEQDDAIAHAALNLAIGLNAGIPTNVVDTSEVPPFTMGLGECLQTAVNNRREFQVVRKTIQVAIEGSNVARADFAPRIIAGGYLNDFQQSDPRAHAELGVGFIRLDWGLYQGGRRIAELRVTDARIQEAQAEAESIADTIAFQVSQAYHQLVAARKAIDRSLPAVDQTRETYRLVSARNREGDATPAELTDAEASLTRAQQDYANAIYDYLTALARLNFVLGVPTSLDDVRSDLSQVSENPSSD
jgi:outer membrane protein